MEKSKKIKLCGKYNVGDKVSGVVKRVEPYGAFVQLEDGMIGLIHIEDLSVARIKSPTERVNIGQNLDAMIKYINRDEGKIDLSYKEFWGTWEENASKFKQGTTTKGIIKETEKSKNGIFIELTPNLVGMAEYETGHNYGDSVDVYIKKIDPDKKKVKLVILNNQ